MNSIELSQISLSKSNEIYQDLVSNIIPTKNDGTKTYPETFDQDNYLSYYLPTDKLTFMSNSDVVETGKPRYALTPMENSVIHLILSNAMNVQRELLSYMASYINDMTVFRSSNNNLYDFNMLPHERQMIKSFLDKQIASPTINGPAGKYISAIGFQFIKITSMRFSFEECDFIYCDINLGETGMDGKYATSCNFYNSTISIGQGVVLTGCRFFNCTLIYSGGSITINDNDVNNGRSTIFTDSIVPQALRDALIDREGNNISNKIK